MCPAAQRFAALVARKLAASGGAALFVDYGKDGPPASSLRGIVDHAFVDPLLRCAGGSLLRWVAGVAAQVCWRPDQPVGHSFRAGMPTSAATLLPLLPLRRPGEADLSVDVDFDAVRRAARSEAAGLRVSPLLNQRDFLAAMGLEPR